MYARAHTDTHLKYSSFHFSSFSHFAGAGSSSLVTHNDDHCYYVFFSVAQSVEFQNETEHNSNNLFLINFFFFFFHFRFVNLPLTVRQTVSSRSGFSVVREMKCIGQVSHRFNVKSLNTHSKYSKQGQKCSSSIDSRMKTFCRRFHSNLVFR